MDSNLCLEYYPTTILDKYGTYLFHDINNMLTSLLGNSQLLSMEMPDNNEIKQILKNSERLYAEIEIQKIIFKYKDTKYLLRKFRCYGE